MTKKLSWRESMFVGSMLFGLFFGAGNLIFPVHMGQEAGANILSANIGFLVTGIGLPFLGVIAMGLSRSKGLFDLAKRVNRNYAIFLTVLLYLTIGPFFALPRLATTSFEISVAPFIGEQYTTLGLAIFSVLFFVVAWLLARKPTKIIDYVGKFLTPVFLLLLAILLVLAFAQPMGDIAHVAVQEAYISQPFATGFTQGYNTLDALASLAFGIVVITTIQQMGVTSQKQMAKETIKAGSVSVILMGIIYSLLAYMGAMSIGKFTLSQNGGIALAQIANYYLGNLGSVLLAFIVIFACLKTAIGLLTAFGETFAELFPQKNYSFYVIVASVLPCIFANVGLTNIIQISVPVLMFLYPLAIILMILAIISPLFHHQQIVYQITTYTTLLAALLDALNASPAIIKNIGFVQSILNLAERYLPLFSLGMGWVTPALLGLVLSFIWIQLHSQKTTDA